MYPFFLLKTSFYVFSLQRISQLSEKRSEKCLNTLRDLRRRHYDQMERFLSLYSAANILGYFGPDKKMSPINPRKAYFTLQYVEILARNLDFSYLLKYFRNELFSLS